MPLSDCLLQPSAGGDAIPIWFVEPETISSVTAVMSSSAHDWIRHTGFEPQAGEVCLLPGAGGRIQAVLFGLGRPGHHARTPFLPGRLARGLPGGKYRFGNLPDDPALATLAFALSSYRFTRYKSSTSASNGAALVVPDEVDADELRRIADAVSFGRDLINTPANDLGPQDLAAVAVDMARAHGAASEVLSGDTLLDRGFPLIHAVGKGSARPPCLVDIHWGDTGNPKITLVGKGVVFDTGGLDLKSPSNMQLMKKDMGGAACILVLARLIMEAGLPVRLRVLIPAVENAVSGTSFRPLDVIRSRKGLTVEIGDTDAEGRLILADALTLADEDAPDLIIDFATLTGAARVALGPDVPPYYTFDDGLAAEIDQAAQATSDPLWRLPLWRPYLSMLDSKVADVNNISGGPFAGSVTAALFMSKFVERAKSWLHADIYGWSTTTKPGKVEGGEVQAARAVFEMLKRRYG